MCLHLMRACVLPVGSLLVAAPAQAYCPSVPKETYEALKIDRSASPKELYQALVKRYLDPEGGRETWLRQVLGAGL
ncbi:MAG: hypothetical protein HP492_12415 [Nitrospira sp.]|nr:hypothetical protein [Nitrospira sp.]